MSLRRGKDWLGLVAICSVFFGIGGALAATDPLATVNPLPAGPYPVACSDVAQNFALAPTDDARGNYWEGTPANGQGVYVNQLLSEPQNTFQYAVNVPNDRSLFTIFAGQPMPYVAIVCYPTSLDNPRPDYPFDAELTKFVPKMQRGPQAPLWYDPNQHYPILLYSHGLYGSPLSSGYLETITLFASHGYVVVAPFHGDGRFADPNIQNFSALISFIFGGGYPKMIELQAQRPLALKAVLDALLADSNYRDHVDANRIAGFGASLGGESLLLLAGAQLTTTFLPHTQTTQVVSDSRLKAIIGYVPYFGQPILNAFGDGESGLANLSIPFLGISGTADTTAPIVVTASGVNRLQGPRYLVAFAGLTHTILPQDVPDIYTYTMIFLDAYLQNIPSARAQMARMTSVVGGAADAVLLDYTAPIAPGPSEALVTEFANPSLGRFFLTASSQEAASIDQGAAGAGWQRTGYLFKGYSAASMVGSPVCRFYSPPGLGSNAHFYTVDPNECQLVSRIGGWTYEGTAFGATPAQAGVCAASLLPVYRAYNHGVASNSEHRYTTSRFVYAQQLAMGWTGEGVAFCSNP